MEASEVIAIYTVTSETNCAADIILAWRVIRKVFPTDQALSARTDRKIARGYAHSMQIVLKPFFL
jgi:hypothetical protein